MLSELWRPSLIFAALPFVVYIGQNCLHRVHVYLEELGLKEEMNFVNQALDLFVEFDHVTDEDLVLLEGVLVNVGKRVESLMTSEVSKRLNPCDQCPRYLYINIQKDLLQLDYLSLLVQITYGYFAAWVAKYKLPHSIISLLSFYLMDSIFDESNRIPVGGLYRGLHKCIFQYL